MSVEKVKVVLRVFHTKEVAVTDDRGRTVKSPETDQVLDVEFTAADMPAALRRLQGHAGLLVESSDVPMKEAGE